MSRVASSLRHLPSPHDPVPAHRGRPLRLERIAWGIPAGERANVVTHALGAIGFAIAGGLLVVHAAQGPALSATVPVLVFVCTLVAMYTASAVYHASTHPGHRPVLRALDHSAIYLLIAGTYTPFAVDLGGFWGGLLLAIVWPVAAIGIALKLLVPMRPRWLSTGIYVVMGWMVVIAAEPFIAHFPPVTLAWLVLGGLAYTAGTPFYMRSHLPWMHALWHGFVLLGSLFHFMAVVSMLDAPRHLLAHGA